MKQSTFSAVMANSIKNLLQGYTKGIRFVAVLTMLLTMGIGQAWGADTWTLVKNVSELAVGDEVVIAASSSNYALGTTQNSNNRDAVSITKSGDNITWTGTSVQVLTLKEGTVSGTFAFYTGSGYLYAASSSKNYLRTQTTNNANGSWKITITSTGVASITAQGTNTNNQLKKNSSSALFSCYSSGQNTVAIYKKQAACSYNINYTTNNQADGAGGTWSEGNCFEQVGSTTEWRYEMTLPGGGGSFWVGNGAWVNNKSEVQSLSSITFVGLQGTSCGTKPYPGEGAVGYVRIYSDSGSKNYYAAFQPTYQIAFGIEGGTWQHKPFALVSDNKYETALLDIPADFSANYKYYVGPKNSANTTNWVNGKSSTDAMNTMVGMTDINSVKGGKGIFRIYDNSCANNWYCSFIPYYNYKLLNDDGSVFYASDYVSSEATNKATTIYSSIPTKTGHTFVGWSRTKNATTADVEAGDSYNYWKANDTFYPVWEAKIYTITSNLTNCSSSPAIPTSYTYTGSAANLSYTISAASGYRLPDAVTVSGTTYTWDKNNGLLKLTGTINSNVIITITAIKVHTITWKVNKQTYTTGSVDDGATYKNLTLPTTPPADNTLDECYSGKKFVGWSTTNIGSTESDKPTILFKTAAEAPNTAITENTILYAVFATESTTGSGSEGWGKVTSTADLKAGDFYAISSAATEGTYLSTYTGGNNYPASSTTICKLELGGSSGAWTFKIADGSTYNNYYLTATSTTGSNHLKAVSTADDYSKFTISFSSNAAVITCTGKTSRNILRYNGSNDPPIFSCYSSGQSAVYLQKYSAGTTTETTGYVTECCTLNNITLDGSGTTTGGTFSATATKACKGEDITLTATAAECYEFVSWTIKKTSDDTDVTNSVLDGNTLTMPDYAVTVYATFKSLSVTEIALSMTGEHKNLDVGETNQLVVTYTPADATCDNAIVSWTSSNDNILSVSNTGLVTANMAGEATITATTEGGVTATYTITVNNPTCDSWYIHYWNNSTNGDECFYKVKPDDPNDHEWRTNNFSLPSFSNDDMFIVNNAQAAGGDSQKTDQIFRTGIGFADIQRGEQSCGTNPYPGQDAYGQLSIYDDSNSPNRYIAFYPAQYLVTYGKEGAAPWEVLPLNNTTGYEYETEPFMVPNGYKTDDAYKYYVGITDKNGNIKYVGYEFGGVEYKKSSVDPMNTVNGLSADDMAGKWGTWHIYSNSCANNWYAEFIRYYRVDFDLNGGEGDIAPRYGKVEEPYVTFSTSDITAPTRDGYTFLGWKDINNKIYAPTGATVTINNDFTLTALWKENYASDNCRWEEVTIDYIEYGDEVVVVMVHGETLYALPYDSKTASNSNPEATTITTDDFAGTVADTLIWYIMKGDGNTFTLSPKTAINKYLTCNSSNNAVRIDTDSERYFTIGNGFLQNTTYSTYLAISTTATPPDWRHFTSTNATIANKYQTLKFYKKVCLPEGQYRVTWDANGGAWSDGSTTKEEIYTGGDPINLPEEPELDGYKFDSWEPTPSTMPAENTTFTAKWTEVYTINFYSNGTQYGSSQEVEASEIVTLPMTDPTSCDANYSHFFGWTEIPIDGVSNTQPTDLIQEDFTPTRSMNLHAVFVDELPQLGGWELVTSTEGLIEGDIYTISSTNSTSSGYVFGQQKENNRAAVSWTTGTPVELTLGGSIDEWTLYDAAYDNGAGGYLCAASSSKNYLRTVSEITDNAKWHISISNQKVTITAKGSYTRNTIRYNDNDANNLLFSCYDQDAGNVYLFKRAVGTTPNGYITNCCTPWEAPTLSATTSIAVGGNTTITPNSGTTYGNVTYSSSDETIATVDADGKVTGRKPGKVTITATWDGVDGVNNYCPAEATIDITVTGSFTITYNANHASATGTTASTIIAYPDGTGTVATNGFELNGHEFVKWNTKNDGSGTSYNAGDAITLTNDTTLYAIWQPNQYDITVNVVGGSVKLGSTTITTQQTIADVVAHGQSFTFTNATPDAAYSSTYTVTLNSGTATITSNSLTVSNVQSDLDITITFTAKPTFTVTYVVPAEDGRSVAPTSIYEGGSVTMPGITGDINNAYSCEELIGWTTEAGYQSGTYEDMNGQMPTPFYAIGATLSDITEATTLYAVYKRAGQGASGTVELTQSNIQDFYTNTTSENRAYNIEKTYTASEYSFMTNGQLSVYSSTTYRINLRNRTNSNGISWIKLPALPGEITRIEANVSQGNSNTTSYVLALQTGTTTNETVVASSESTSGISRTIDVPSGHTSGYITCTSDGTINVESLVIHYGAPNIISTFLKCTNDIDEVTINYHTNTSYLPAGSVVNNTCNNETFKFSELPNGQYTICDKLTPPAFYQHIGWNSQANGNGSVSYEPGQVITMVDYTPVNLYAQWAPEVVVIDGDATSGEVMVPETMGGSITLPTGSQLCDDPAYHYDFIGWTTEDALLWNQGVLSPEILPMNGDGTTTFTPTEPTTVYAVYGQEKTANSKAFYLTYTHDSQTYYAQLHNNYILTGTTEKTNAVKLYMEQIAKEYSDRYYLYYIQDNEKVYVSWNSASDKLHIPSSATENDGWIVATSGSNYTFQSVAAYNNLAIKYLKAVVDNDNQRFDVGATAFNFQLESTSEYVYLDNTTCSDQIRIKFVDGGGTLKDGTTDEELTTPYMYATAGDAITLPYCEYDGWEFLGWVEEFIEPTEIIEDASRIHQGKSSFTVPTYNTDLYAYYEQQPEEADFDATEAVTLKMYSTVEINGTNKYYFAQGLGSQNQLTTSNICALGLTWNFIPVENEAGKCYIQDTLSGLFLSAVPNDNDFAFTEQPETWNFVNTDTVPAMNLDANNKWWIWNDKTPDRMILFQNNADMIVNGAKSNFTSSPGTYNLITIGECFNPVYTTDPILCQSVSVSGVNKITATKGQSVKSSTRLIFMARNQELQTQVTISAPNIKFYNRNGDEVTSIPITSSNVKEYLIAEYTPTEYDVLEKINITAVSSRKTITIKNRLTCRSLPENFAIVTQVGKLWYALPSNCSTSGNPVGYPVEVDDMNDPTTVTAVPENADWQLRRVYKSNGTDDRYTENGDNLVFTETSADSKTLYGSTSTTAAIQTYAKYENYYQTNPGNYEWTPTTTDLVDYKLKNEARKKYLSANFLTEYGIHSSQVANSEVRFLLITGRYTPLAAQVVEWKENSVVIMYNGDPTQTASVYVNGGTEQTTTLSSAQKDIAVYELTATGLASNPGQLLKIVIGSEQMLLPIPYIIGSAQNDIDLLVGSTVAARQEVAKVADLVVLKDAKLTAAGATSNPYKFRHVTIYGGGKLVIPSEKGFGVSSLTMRVGAVESGNYKALYPQLVLNGSINTGNINIDYLTTYDRYYALSLPYEVATTDILYPTDIYGDVLNDGGNQASFALQWYNGEARASETRKGWTDLDEPATLEPYKGYTFWGAPRKVSVNGESKRQNFGIHRIPIKPTANDLITGETSTKQIVVEAHPAANAYDAGWNFLGNPYLAQYGNMEDEHTSGLLGMLTQNPETGVWEHTGNYRYITLTDDGKTYWQTPVSEAELYPFNTFFVQAGEKGAVSFNASNRASLPARRYAAQQETAKEITTGIILSGNDQTDRTGLLIADNFTEEYDFNADLSKFENSGINLYTIGKDGKLAFMAINQALAEQPIPLGYGAPADGEYTIAFDEDRYNATDISALYLIDYDRNEKTNLLHTEYSFVTAAGTNNERFALQVAFIPQNATSVEWVDDATIQVAVDGNNLLLNNLPTDAGVQVFDALGRVIYATPNAPTEMQITLPTGYYLVRIADKQHAVVINTVIP